MSTQQQAAQLYRDTQDAAAEAWAGAATNATAHMHPYSPQASEDAEQIEAITPWYPAHPHALYGRALLLRWLVGLGTLCLYGAGLALATVPVWLARVNHDGRWLGAALAGWLIVYLVWRAWRARK